METTTARQDVVRRIYAEAFAGGRDELIEEFFSPEVVNHTAPPAARQGVEPIRTLFAMLRQAFPDGRTVIEDMVESGDTVVMRCWYEGTHKGVFFGHEPTGREFRFRQIHWFRFGPDDRVTDHWGVRDDVAHLQQLGIID